MRCNVVALLQSWCAVLQLQKGLPSFRRLSAEIVNHSCEWDEYLKVCRTVCFQFSILARITNAVCLCTYTTVHVRTWYTFTCMHVYMFTISQHPQSSPSLLVPIPGYGDNCSMPQKLLLWRVLQPEMVGELILTTCTRNCLHTVFWSCKGFYPSDLRHRLHQHTLLQYWLDSSLHQPYHSNIVLLLKRRQLLRISEANWGYQGTVLCGSDWWAPLGHHWVSAVTPHARRALACGWKSAIVSQPIRNVFIA